MENYPSNSYKSRREKTQKTSARPKEKKIEKVVTGTTKIKKKSNARKFIDVFIPEDIDNVKEYIVMDVMIPAAKKLISDIVDTALFGGSRRTRSSGGRGVSFIDYSRSTSRERERSGARGRNDMETSSFEEVVFDTRGDAEAVLMGMDEIISQYGVVSISDFNELAGVSGKFTDSNYGWNSLRTAKVQGCRDGYVIKFPRAMVID